MCNFFNCHEEDFKHFWHQHNRFNETSFVERKKIPNVKNIFSDWGGMMERNSEIYRIKDIRRRILLMGSGVWRELFSERSLIISTRTYKHASVCVSFCECLYGKCTFFQFQRSTNLRLEKCNILAFSHQIHWFFVYLQINDVTIQIQLQKVYIFFVELQMFKFLLFSQVVCVLYFVCSHFNQ